jgi:hypothetical protein
MGFELSIGSLRLHSRTLKTALTPMMRWLCRLFVGWLVLGGTCLI